MMEDISQRQQVEAAHVATTAALQQQQQHHHQQHHAQSDAERLALRAIRSDELPLLLELIESNQLELQRLSGGGANLMLACCELDRKNCLRHLLKLAAGQQPAAAPLAQLALNEDQMTPLMVAAKKNSIQCLLVLLASGGAKINATDQYEWTALMYACYYGNHTCARLLLEAGAFVNVYDTDHLSCLIWAAGRGHAEIVKLLLKFGAKVDACDKYGTTPLIWACRKGHNKVVELLLQSGANINATGMFGWSALLTTVRGNFIHTTKLLLKHEHLNVNTCDTQRLSPLIIASKDGLQEIARLLLERGAFVNLSDRYGHTALIHAAKSGHLDIVELLVQAKADIDHIGFDKKSAIFWAVEKSNLEMVRALLRARPNLEINTNEGETCLIRAVKSKRFDVIKMLLAHGAKVSATDKSGDTVLHTAVRLQSRPLVELLLANPKNCQLIYKPNKRKETPFSIDQAAVKPIFPSLLDEYDARTKSTFASSPFKLTLSAGASPMCGLEEQENKASPLDLVDSMGKQQDLADYSAGHSGRHLHERPHANGTNPDGIAGTKWRPQPAGQVFGRRATSSSNSISSMA